MSSPGQTPDKILDRAAVGKLFTRHDGRSRGTTALTNQRPPLRGVSDDDDDDDEGQTDLIHRWQTGGVLTVRQKIIIVV